MQSLRNFQLFLGWLAGWHLSHRNSVWFLPSKPPTFHIRCFWGLFHPVYNWNIDSEHWIMSHRVVLITGICFWGLYHPVYNIWLVHLRQWISTVCTSLICRIHFFVPRSMVWGSCYPKICQVVGKGEPLFLGRDFPIGWYSERIAL